MRRLTPGGGTGRHKQPYTLQKLTVWTREPGASPATTTAAKPGVRRNERRAKRRSWIKMSMAGGLRSLVAQRHDRVDANGAGGGQPGGGRRTQGEDQGHDHERGRIVGANPEQDALHEA